MSSQNINNQNTYQNIAYELQEDITGASIRENMVEIDDGLSYALSSQGSTNWSIEVGHNNSESIK